MISTKKYLFILLGFLIAIMYLNSASVLAEDRQNRTSDSYYVEEVSYRYIDEDTEEVFKEEKRDIFRKAGLSYTATLAEDWEHASRNNGLIEERIEGEQGKTYTQARNCSGWETNCSMGLPTNQNTRPMAARATPKHTRATIRFLFLSRFSIDSLSLPDLPGRSIYPFFSF